MNSAENSAENPADQNAGGLAPGLYIVATPLGNARDITLRALDTLARVAAIYCEDTRTSGKLMALHNITTTRIAYHEHNAAGMRPKILARLAHGAALALISDAGTPLISDPGMPLVRAARGGGHAVFTVPGPSAPVAALSIAGLPTDRFSFVGFLPPRKGPRRKVLTDLVAYEGTLVLFESPRRLAAMLADVSDIMPDRELVITRELTKKFEQLISGEARVLAAQFAAMPPRGEIVVLLGPAPTQATDTDVGTSMGSVGRGAKYQAIDILLQTALRDMSLRDVVKTITMATGEKRKTIYHRALRLESQTRDKDNNPQETPTGPEARSPR